MKENERKYMEMRENERRRNKQIVGKYPKR
jgi:hypothetical protein